MWGFTYQPSSQLAVTYTTTHVPVGTAAEFGRLRSVDPETGALGEQLEALAQVRAGVGPDTPISWTIFSPLMVARFLMRGGQAQVLEMLRSSPGELKRGLEAITETLVAYAAACVRRGADGIFYATTAATRDQLTDEECRSVQRPYDLRILEAVSEAPFNVMHVCGDDVLFDEFVDYPVAAFSWATTPQNPSLAEGHRRTGRAIIGGIPGKPTIKSMTDSEVAACVRDAVDEMRGRWLLLGPGCSINPDTPERLLHTAREAAQRTQSSFEVEN